MTSHTDIIGDTISKDATNEKCNGNGICTASATVLPDQAYGDNFATNVADGSHAYLCRFHRQSIHRDRRH